MASISITFQWAAGDVLLIEADADNSYPDAFAEASSIAYNLYTKALAVTLAITDAAAAEVIEDE
jgi:hypothetical protein